MTVHIPCPDAAATAKPEDAVEVRPVVHASHHGTDVSLTWVRLSGRHRPLRTDRSTRLYYILDGEAFFVVGNAKPFAARKDDVVVVPKGTPYEFWGASTYLVINSPAFVEGDDVYDL